MMTIEILDNINGLPLTKRILSKTIDSFLAWITGLIQISCQIMNESDAMIRKERLVIVLRDEYYVMSGIFWFF
jgi:hypothetical protein